MEVQPPAPADPDLASLIARGRALDADTAAAQAPPPDPNAPPVPDITGDARGVVDIAADTLASFFPSTAKALPEAKRAEITAKLTPVMEKHSAWLLAFLGKWGAEISLAFSVATIAIPVANAIRADRAAAALEKPKPEPLKAADGSASPPPPPAPDAPGADLYSRC